jgi:hypothetical protein
MSDHFIVEQPVGFSLGDTIKPRYSDDHSIIGFDRVSLDGMRTPIAGRMVSEPPRDERTRMPLMINGIQLWYGW